MREFSAFAHLAPVPLYDVARPATIAMTAAGVAMIVVAALGYRRRDLRP